MALPLSSTVILGWTASPALFGAGTIAPKRRNQVRMLVMTSFFRKLEQQAKKNMPQPLFAY